VLPIEGGECLARKGLRLFGEGEGSPAGKKRGGPSRTPMEKKQKKKKNPTELPSGDGKKRRGPTSRLGAQGRAPCPRTQRKG